MSFTVKYISGPKTIELKMSKADIQVYNYLKEHGYESEVNAILGVLDFGKKENIKTTILRDSVNRLYSEIKNNPFGSPYIYALNSEIILKNGKRVPGKSSSISGVRIDGKMYRIIAGLGRCNLVEICQDEKGNWIEHKTIDIRDQKTVVVDGGFAGEYGISDIQIEKKKPNVTINRQLESLLDYLDGIESEYVEKFLG